MQRALLLAYHYPPLGGVAVMRVLRFSRYLKEYGWDPIIITVEGGAKHEPRDPNLLEEVPHDILIERVPCFEPDNFVNSWTVPRDKILRNAFKLFDRIVFPDDRAFWVRPVVRRIQELVHRYQPQVIWATAQPWSTLVAGMYGKKATGLPLVLDFRDDWTTSNADFRKTRHLHREEALEREVLASADAVISVTPHIVQALKDRRPPNLSESRIYYIPNGFDPAHFEPHALSFKPQPFFTLLHAGGLYDKRPIQPLLDSLLAWFAIHPQRKDQVQVILAGTRTSSIDDAIDRSGLSDRITRLGFIPHAHVRQLMLSSDLNVLMIEQVTSAPWLFTGKVFEYLGARRPILMLGPDPSPLATLLRATGLGHIQPYSHPQDTATLLENLFLQRHEISTQAKLAKIDDFDARHQCAQLANVFQTVASP